MRILYLYAEVMGYTMATIRELADSGCEVHVVHWDVEKLTPYIFDQIPGVRFYPKSSFNVATLNDFALQLGATVVVVSGWQELMYIAVARSLRRANIPVVCALDGQWHGTIRQFVGSVYSRINLCRKAFSHAWVAGPRQYEYARRLGFKKSSICMDLLSADTGLFNEVYLDRIVRNSGPDQNEFVFVGRLEKEKGIDTLLEAWRVSRKRCRNWTLKLIGDGSMREALKNEEQVECLGFLQPEQVAERIKGGGIFVLPSDQEPWGVVVHEFAAAGYPLLLSNSVGASTVFLIDGHNGFSFEAGSPHDLAKKMECISGLDQKVRREMSLASHDLSHRITPKTSAANLLSVTGQSGHIG